MSDQSDANPKITQVADPRFKRLNDAFAKYLLAKEDHIGFLEDFVKAVIDHTPADVPHFALSRVFLLFQAVWIATKQRRRSRRS